MRGIRDSWVHVLSVLIKVPEFIVFSLTGGSSEKIYVGDKRKIPDKVFMISTNCFLFRFGRTRSHPATPISRPIRRAR